jgi:hypothetical protein
MGREEGEEKKSRQQKNSCSERCDRSAFVPNEDAGLLESQSRLDLFSKLTELGAGHSANFSPNSV